jgi:predicted ABC-type ATPase
MINNFSYFITGVNGAGKSTVVPLLRNNLPSSFLVYDFDEVGVPENVDNKWRQKTTAHWMDIAIKNNKKNIKTVICGLTKPSEIKEISKTKKGLKVKIAFLDVYSRDIEKRLQNRFKKPGSVQALKRVTGLTVRDCIIKNIENAKRLRKECKNLKCKVFNTSRTTPKKSVEKIVNWMVCS